MAKITRTKELWHIPKRGSVHQTIYMVHVLSWDKFLAKSWSSGKQESLGTEMGKAGLTESGKAITHQSVRTLLANLPKYLGFIYIDESSSPARIMVTDIGYELIKKHNVKDVPKHKNLKEYYEAGDLIETSEVFEKQMSKLIITNPVIKKDCEGILVFPFRMTLKILLELDYLDKEEIGYILFHTKSEDQLPLLIERIRNFRNLHPTKRTSEIEAYEKTEEGQLTLIKAPTAGYYMYLCFSTGLCERCKVKANKTKNAILPAIRLKDKEKVLRILRNFENAEIYDFKDDLFLWKEYFTNPKRLYPPFDISVRVNSDEDVLITVIKDDYIVGADSISKRNSLIVPVFGSELYKIMIYDLETGTEIYNRDVSFSKDKKDFSIDLKLHKHLVGTTKADIVQSIKEMFSGKYSGVDKEYARKLEIIRQVLSKNYFDNRRKGGRLEYLYFDLLRWLKNKKIIDEVFWYGSIGKYGICEPAPGGKEGNPDIVFEIDDYMFILEVTTFRGNRAQWNSAEASSVPDHIIKIKKTCPEKKIVGIFSAPSIHHQLAQNLMLNAQKENIAMLFKPCIEFSEFLAQTNRKELQEVLIKDEIDQLKR
jgi:hypothetical protein